MAPAAVLSLTGAALTQTLMLLSNHGPHHLLFPRSLQGHVHVAQMALAALDLASGGGRCSTGVSALLVVAQAALGLDARPLAQGEGGEAVLAAAALLPAVGALAHALLLPEDGPASRRFHIFTRELQGHIPITQISLAALDHQLGGRWARAGVVFTTHNAPLLRYCCSIPNGRRGEALLSETPAVRSARHRCFTFTFKVPYTAISF